MRIAYLRGKIQQSYYYLPETTFSCSGGTFQGFNAVSKELKHGWHENERAYNEKAEAQGE